MRTWKYQVYYLESTKEKASNTLKIENYMKRQSGRNVQKMFVRYKHITIMCHFKAYKELRVHFMFFFSSSSRKHTYRKENENNKRKRRKKTVRVEEKLCEKYKFCFCAE